MIESTHDYKSWRDSLHDSAKPEPDEHEIRFYSHDYTADTTLEYTRQGDRAELTLSFSSEDPDMGVEEMVYGGENRESMAELVSDLKSEITGYLDAGTTLTPYFDRTPTIRASLAEVQITLMISLLMVILTRRFIRPEEDRLLTSFGAAFDAYVSQTRRWI